ncbi:MAG TPA: S8 family serine peptidase, partial [Chloroflexota bacterium]|nr:S8 family serine peptidase [Chloroflexota bacterium]
MEVRGFSPSLLSQAARTPMHMIFLLRPGAGAQTASVIRTLQQSGAGEITPLGLINGVAAQVSDKTLTALRYDPALLTMTLDQIHQPLPTPDAAELAAQMERADLQSAGGAPPGAQVIQQPDAVHIIHADAAQKRYNGRGVRVAIVDSGIDYGHPDLQGIMLKGANGKPLYADFTGTDLTDTVGHGTAVAGIIAAQARTVYSVTNTYRTAVYPLTNPQQRFDNRTYFTVGGVAPGARIMAAKIFDSRLPGGGGLDSIIVRAIQWAIANHADVINESFGGGPQTNTSTDVIGMANQQAVRHGITVVAADGNSGPGVGSVGTPAQDPDVIAVGASTDYQLFGETGFLADYNGTTFDNIASFTSRGPTYDGRIRPDVFAPGSFGWSTVPRNPSEERSSTPPYLLETFGGTSMATPVTVGTVALVINAYMETHGGRRPSPAYVKQVLTSSADSMGYPAADQAAGRVNADRAIAMVLHQGPSILLSGSLALYGKAGDRPGQKITVTNSGSTPEQVTLDPQATRTSKVLNFGGTVVADNLVTYAFDVPPGIAKLTASAYWNNLRGVPIPNQQGVPVVLRVRLYDPHGNFVNYTYSGAAGSANVRTTAGVPAPGRWTAVIDEEGGRSGNLHLAHYLVNVPFSGMITMDTFGAQGGTVSPRVLTLKPGQRATVTYTAGRLTGAGTQIITLHAREKSLAPAPAGQPAETVATIPVVITTAMTIVDGRGTFSGAFSGADNVGLDEVNFYNFSVPAHTSTIALTLQWPH